MQPHYEYGDAVRVIRNVRNDGTFPGMHPGELLIRRGSVGHVVNVGTFLQDQIIYSVHFLDAGRMVGCREEELIGAQEPWIPSLYEVREKVQAAKVLAIRGAAKVPAGARGEVLNLIRDAGGGVVYHVHFDCLPGTPLAVPESAIRAVERSDG
ncbi:MAG: nitrogen fixation protein NifZ [Rhodocyclaceae bacterium]|jgi:nitrogen fixation protein NifZ|nr:nitrogen fixation protein NifZ [Rhodocyclaceae bacterium]